MKDLMCKVVSEYLVYGYAILGIALVICGELPYASGEIAGFIVITWIAVHCIKESFWWTLHFKGYNKLIESGKVLVKPETPLAEKYIWKEIIDASDVTLIRYRNIYCVLVKVTRFFRNIFITGGCIYLCLYCAFRLHHLPVISFICIGIIVHQFITTLFKKAMKESEDNLKILCNAGGGNRWKV